MEIDVTVIIPVYNEEKYLEVFLTSIINQNYEKEKIEWIFVDGGSNDNTISIIQQFSKEYPLFIRVLNNEKKIPASAMNIGIKESMGEFIIRFDAHTKYPEDYIAKCIHYLKTTDAVNVGGSICTVGKGYWGKLNAAILSSKFGVGNSKFRTEKKTEFVDTVPFGAFRKVIFDQIGLFDERLARSEDNELNYRIRKNGGKVLMAEDIYSIYYCRDSLSGLLKMAFENGKAVGLTSKLCPGAMSYRHYVPLIFVMSLLFLFLTNIFSNYYLWRVGLILEGVSYLFLCFVFSIKNDSGKINPDCAILMGSYFMFHVYYGAGTLSGIIENLKSIEI